MLVTIDNLVSGDELAHLRALLAQSPWDSGLATAGPQAALVKNNQQLPEHASTLPELRTRVLDALQRAPLFFTAALPLKILPPFFNRYAGPSNAYGFHTDNAMRMLPGQAGCYVRSDISATLFLSDPEDYEGGVLTIEDTFGKHGVKGKAGSLVLYRLACFLFIQSMVRDAAQRRLLYDMDMALLQLRQGVGETDPVVRLTGTYHNLLRSWAQT